MPETKPFHINVRAEITPDKTDPLMCGRALCQCHVSFKDVRFCSAFREFILGQRRVSRCLSATPET